MAVWIAYNTWNRTLHPRNGCYISEEEYQRLPYPVMYLPYDKKRDDLRKYYRVTSVIFGREEPNGKVTVFKDGIEAEILEKKSDFVEKYFIEAI